jgi:hypothetical protein
MEEKGEKVLTNVSDSGIEFTLKNEQTEEPLKSIK